MDKYYTPEIKEFHVGFEYEVRVPEGKLWSKETFHLNKSHIDLIKYVNIQDEFTHRAIRVKYLDKKDIEDLGFTETEDFADAYHLQEIEVFKCRHLIIVHVGWNNKILLKSANFIRDGSGNYKGFTTHFNGKIKNKSELRDIVEKVSPEPFAKNSEQKKNEIVRDYVLGYLEKDDISKSNLDRIPFLGLMEESLKYDPFLHLEELRKLNWEKSLNRQDQYEEPPTHKTFTEWMEEFTKAEDPCTKLNEEITKMAMFQVTKNCTRSCDIHVIGRGGCTCVNQNNNYRSK